MNSRTIITSIITAIVIAAGVIAVPKVTAFDNNPVSGIDIADWQHPGSAAIDWKQVESDDQKFAFIKATEGQGYTNPYFVQDSNDAKAAGMHIGSYHYAKPGQSAAVQAAHYASVLRSQPQPSLPPVLDIETTDGLGPAAVQRWTREFVTEIEALTGRKPIIYTYRYFWIEQMADTTEFTNYPLWLAAYQNNVPTELPGGWDYMTFWQRSDKGQVSGIVGDTDMNLFNGTESELDSFAAGNSLNLGKLLTPDFETSKLIGGSSGLDVLSQNNAQLVGVILTIALGVTSIGALNDAATAAGFDLGPAQQLVSLVQSLIDANALPVGDLKKMAEKDTYNIGDLLILLDNAGK